MIRPMQTTKVYDLTLAHSKFSEDFFKILVPKQVGYDQISQPKQEYHLDGMYDHRKLFKDIDSVL